VSALKSPHQIVLAQEKDYGIRKNQQWIKIAESAEMLIVSVLSYLQQHSSGWVSLRAHPRPPASDS
jgi:hypothetical protein